MRLGAADDVIENDTSEEALFEKVSALHRRYLDESSRIASRRQEMKE